MKLGEETRQTGGAAVWFRQKSPAMDGLTVVSGECPLVWPRGADWIYCFHRTLGCWAGTLPL